MDYHILTNEALMRQIGMKLKELRISKEMKQQELAAAAGLSVFTVSAVENGKGGSLLTLIQLLRALERLDQLDSFFQEPTFSPIAYAKLLNGDKKRKRIKSSKKSTRTRSAFLPKQSMR
ncbi:MAG: helix-turn-helix domain-containing protein [Bacteroidales bacterium]|nr:helix-turn-helix domain-containing protein [Bacteroidales bacterium]